MSHATLQFYRGNFATTVDIDNDCWSDPVSQAKILDFLQRNNLHVRLVPPGPPPIISIDELIKVLRQEGAELNLVEGQLTLGMAIDLIKQIDQEQTTRLRVDFDSYRGCYEDLAAEFDHAGAPRTVAKLLEDFEDQIGATHSGWKGGEYQMYEDTRCWIAPAGFATGIPLTAISLLTAINNVELVCER